MVKEQKKHWNFETFGNSYDAMKPRLLKSRDFGSWTTRSEPLIRNKWFTNVSELREAVIQKRPSLSPTPVSGYFYVLSMQI